MAPHTPAYSIQGRLNLFHQKTQKAPSQGKPELQPPQISGLKLWASSPWTPTPRLGDQGRAQERCLGQMATGVTASSSKHSFSSSQTGSSPGVDG